MYTGCNLWETHVSCRVLLDTIHISFLYFFFVLIILPLSVLPEFVFAFHSPSFVRLYLPFRYFFFIWTVVHLIGCTGLLGTDNWLANNSSNNIRAYDIQVLIYTLHRIIFILFSFLGATTFLARVRVWVYVSLVDLRTSLCRDTVRCWMLCHVLEFPSFRFFSIYTGFKFKSITIWPEIYTRFPSFLTDSFSLKNKNVSPVRALCKN